jgi:hypothetical protein
MTEPTGSPAPDTTAQPAASEAAASEPAASAATAPDTGPTTAVSASGPAASRGRWLIAVLAAAASVAIVAGAVVLLGSRPTPEALTYIPAGSAMVGELRMDLPGDQLQKVGNLLAHFPGFKDQSTLGQKIDETLSRLAGSASKGSVDYMTQVKPWLAGPLFAGLDIDAAHPDRPRFVAVATTDGTADCGKLFPVPGTTTEAVGSLSMTVAADGSYGCLLDGRYGLLGDPTSIKAAVDAHAQHSGMDSAADYRAAREALGGDRLFTVFVSGRLYTELADLAASQPASPLGGANPFGGLGFGASIVKTPSWLITGLRAEDDAIVVDTVAGPPITPSSSASAPAGSPLPPPPSLLTMAPDRASRLAPLVPGDSLVLIDVHGAGIASENALTLLRANPALGQSFGQIDSTLSALGGAHQLVGWIDDAGIVVMPDGSSATGGVILLAPDDATATAKVAQIRGFLALATGGAGITDTTISGTAVTLIDVGNLGSLLGSTGLPAPAPGGATPSISLAAHGSAVLIGTGESFMHHMLETPAGASLADQTTYQALVKRTADRQAAQVYIAASKILALADAAIPADQKGSFDTDVRPYLEPFDIIYASSWTQGDLTRQRILVTVK